MASKSISVSEAHAGMITARDIKDNNGRILIQSGSRLNPIAIRRFPIWNIKSIYIEYDSENDEDTSTIEDETEENILTLNNDYKITLKFAEKIKNRFRSIPQNDFYKEYRSIIVKHILDNKDNEAISGLD